MGLYENVKAICAEHNTNVYRVEQELGFPRSSICKWDENKPSIERVKRLADYLGESIDRIVGETGG